MTTRFYLLVGVQGFEPWTPCSQSRCANRAALRPEQLISAEHNNLIFIQYCGFRDAKMLNFDQPGNHECRIPYNAVKSFGNK